VQDGQVKIVTEGKARKFVTQVQQNTFSGPYAVQRSQPVLYVTERCVFKLTPEGLELVEVAPGIDIERDILAHMDFEPVVNNPVPMDPRIFREEPMELAADLLNLDLKSRVSYDTERNILFVNLEGWYCRVRDDLDELRMTIVAACREAGQRVNAVINHDGFRLNDNLVDDYAGVVQYLQANYYATTTRYATSAFMRLKMEEALTKRGVAPHVFERKEEAQAFLLGHHDTRARKRISPAVALVA
jgi:propionate CoA-transferase